MCIVNKLVSLHHYNDQFFHFFKFIPSFFFFCIILWIHKQPFLE